MGHFLLPGAMCTSGWGTSYWYVHPYDLGCELFCPLSCTLLRLVQRMGRTGRKRDGRIVELVTKGKEEQVGAPASLPFKLVTSAMTNG